MTDIAEIKRPDRRFAPIQILHDFQFVALNANEDYSSLRTMSFEQKIQEMKRRIDNLARCGYGGVVLNVDFERYLENEESFRVLDEIIDYATGLALRVWLYDEQYYPSGSAGGLVLKGHPELEGQGMACVSRDVNGDGTAVRVPSPCGYSELKYAYAVPLTDGRPDFEKMLDISGCRDIAGGLCWDCDSNEWRVYCFFVRALYEHTYLAESFRASRRYPSIADIKAVERFADITYGAYEKHLKKPLGGRVEAVFTDEPTLMHYTPYSNISTGCSHTRYPSVSIYDRANTDIPIYPYIPWCRGIETGFFEKYGYCLSAALPQIFEEGKDTAKLRADFYGFLGQMTESAFLVTLHNRTFLNGVKLTGHYYGEEDFDRQPAIYGNILSHLGKMDIPGCDLLFSDVRILRYSVACRLASSAAHIYGKPHTMIEASNMADSNQKLTVENIKSAVSVMYIHGIDTVTSYYAEQIFSPKGRSEFSRYTAALGSALNGGKNRINTLLYYPYRQLCVNRQPMGKTVECSGTDTFGIQKAAQRLLQNQICFDFINDECLMNCSVQNGAFITGYGEKIERIVFPEIDCIYPDITEKLRAAAGCGVQLVFTGNARKINGIQSETVFIGEDEPIEKLLCSEAVLSVNDSEILLTHRTFDDCELYMMMNTGDSSRSFELSVPERPGSAVGINPDTAQQKEYQITERATIEIELSSMQCLLLYLV